VVALDRESGEVLWRATDDEASYSSPVAATIGGERHALILTRNHFTDLDPQTGKVRFQIPFQSTNRYSVNAATPLVLDDLVFLSACYNVGAAVFRVKDGGADKVWSSDGALSNHYATSILHEGRLYGFHDRTEYGPSLRCVELKSGKVLWSEDRFGAGTVTLARKLLVILTENGDLVLAPATPGGFAPRARARVLSGTVRAYPALAAGRLYARNEDTLICLDLGGEPRGGSPSR
jgi:outer membrane protein assembly factor BamB